MEAGRTGRSKVSLSEGRGGSNVWQSQRQLARKRQTFTTGAAVAKFNPASLAESDSTEISSISPRMTVVGNISSEGTLNVLGRVEGELHASMVRIDDGAEVEGSIAAQELTIGGRFKGTIQANRVTLMSSAVVEGEIHHRSLAIEENAWFAGVSHPEEAPASEVTDSRSPIQLVP